MTVKRTGRKLATTDRASTPRQRAAGAGRPPSGQDGTRVRDYPALMLRLPVQTLAQMKALSAVRGMPLWRLMNEAALALLAGLKGSEAEDTGRLAKRESERLRVKLGL